MITVRMALTKVVRLWSLARIAEASAILAKLQSLTTFVNAILTVIIAVALYAALRPAMIRTGLFDYNIGIKAKKTDSKE